MRLKDKSPHITSLATTTALIAVEYKIPNVSNLVKKKKKTITQKLVKLKIKLNTDYDNDKFSKQKISC